MPEINKIDTNKLQVWLPFLLSAMVVIGMLVGYKMSGASLSNLIVKANGGSLGTGRVEEVIRYIESKYVDKIDGEELVEEAVQSLLHKLDPHSLYLTPEMVKRTNEEMAGSFNGLGVESMMLDDTLNIYNVLEESPAYAAGLRPGDRVIQIEDSIVVNQNLEFDQIRPLMQKNIGDVVKLMVIPLEGGEPVERKVEIGPVPLHSADIAYMINDKTGYILIKRFGSNTYKEFMLGLEEMFENEGLKNLIIDVRQNPGGYLPQATDILSQLFLQKGHLLVYTEGKNERLTEYMTTGKSFFPIDKIAVLVDGGSASGSEILAGAIQDWDRGIIIGRRTFGKGLVQEQYNLKNGGALRLTTARYYTPAGRLIQKPYKDLDEYAYEQSNRLNSGELEDADKMTINDSTQYFTLKDQRVVYGGGGIIPDYFVPIDSKTLNSDYRAISDYLTEFVYIKFKERYFGNDREIDFDVQQISILYDELKDYVLSKNPSINQDAFEEWKTELSIQLHASIGYQLKGEKEMVKILNRSDHDVQKALEEIGN